MKTFLYSLLIFLGPFYYGSLYGHGFAAETLVSVSSGWLYIEQIAHAKKPHLIHASSFDVRSNNQTTQPIKLTSKNEVNCYFCIGFDASRENDIRCSPSQEFYSTALDGWISAVDMRIGEPLLSRNGESYHVKHIELVHDALTVYSIEVPITHTFFVGNRNILAHNMMLPVVAGLGLSVPFGSGAAIGGAAGSIFGPVSVAAGLAVGSVIGVTVKLLSRSTCHQGAAIAFNVPDIYSHRASLQELNYEIDSQLFLQKNRLAESENENKEVVVVAAGGSPGGAEDPDPNKNKIASYHPPIEPRNKKNKPGLSLLEVKQIAQRIERKIQKKMSTAKQIKSFYEGSISKSIDHTFSYNHCMKGLLKLGSDEAEIFDKIVDILFEVDSKCLLKEGANQIHVNVNGFDLIIRTYFKEGCIHSLNGFVRNNVSERIIGHLIKLG